MSKDILLIFLPLLTGVIGSYATYYFTQKAKRFDSILRNKEEKYSNLIFLLQGFVGNTANGELKRKFLNEFYKSWLYSGENVIQSINSLLQAVMEAKGKSAVPNGKELIGNVIIEMRKDLQQKCKLNPSEYMYVNVYD